LLVLTTTSPSNTIIRTKGTLDRKEKDSRKLCANTTHGLSKKAVKGSVNQ
jgi:hypothetical protein